MIEWGSAIPDLRSAPIPSNITRPPAPSCLRPVLVAAATALVAIAAPPVPLSAAAPPSSFDLQAHRGGRGETTEESLRAFAKSLELGFSTLELDVVVTKDGQPLVWHDPTIQPDKCGDTAPAVAADPQYPYVGNLVHDLTLAQIRTLDCGKLLDGFPGAEAVPGNKIATLPDAFALADSYAADVRYNIETKVEAADPDTSASPQESVDVILAAVRSAGKVGQVEIQSFDWRTLPLVHQVETQCACRRDGGREGVPSAQVTIHGYSTCQIQHRRHQQHGIRRRKSMFSSAKSGFPHFWIAFWLPHGQAV